MNNKINIADQIISKIKKNRISSTEIADCLDKTGAINDVYPLNSGHFRVGKVFWAYAYNESNWEVHEQIRNVKEDEIVIVETFNCKDRAIFGSLVAKFLILYCQASAIVVLGKLRDIPHLIKENWPIWCKGINPVGCYNKKDKNPLDKKIVDKRKRYYEGAIAVCDDTGVVIIPKKVQKHGFLKKLEWIESQEDIWFDCIDRVKWNTFDAVCLKKYMDKEKYFNLIIKNIDFTIKLGNQQCQNPKKG